MLYCNCGCTFIDFIQFFYRFYTFINIIKFLSILYNFNITILQKTLFFSKKKRPLRENAHTRQNIFTYFSPRKSPCRKMHTGQKKCFTMESCYSTMESCYSTMESCYSTMKSCCSTMKSCCSIRKQKYEENGRILHNLAFI